MRVLNFFLRRPLRFAGVVALLIVVIGAIGGGFLTRFGESASLSVHAMTEAVSMENVCTASSIDLALPAGTLRQLIFADHMDAPESSELTLDRPTLLRVSGPFKLAVRRRAEGPLLLTIGPAALDVAENDPQWSAQLFGLPQGAAQLHSHPLQLMFEADAATGSTTLPLVGKVVIGEAVSANHGSLSQSIPRPAFQLLEGTIRVRAATWGVDAKRIELAEQTLELGDVVSTELLDQDKNASDVACVARQAQGSVRLHHDGALEAIAHVDQDYVTVARGRDIRVGASTVQMLSQQPWVTLAWQLAIILFAIVGLVQQLFEIISYYTGRHETQEQMALERNLRTNEDPKPEAKAERSTDEDQDHAG